MKTHVGRLLAKLEARDRVQLVVFAYEHGLARGRRRRASASGRSRSRPRADEIAPAAGEHGSTMSTHAIHPTSAPLTAAPTHHRDGRPVPRWATTAAHLVALCALPSGRWRIPLALGFSMGMLEGGGAEAHVHRWESLYVIGLSVVLESLALLTLGLVAPWGARRAGSRCSAAGVCGRRPSSSRRWPGRSR